jgi:ATP-binding protein involved in chromosome partitioning
MFEKLGVPVFGLIENMSYFICPHCSERTDIFGTGAAEAMADELGIDYLGAIPLHPDVRQGADTGIPIVEAGPSSPLAQPFAEIAQKVAAKTSMQHFFAETAAPAS